jgi:hypothetical protein
VISQDLMQSMVAEAAEVVIHTRPRLAGVLSMVLGVEAGVSLQGRPMKAGTAVLGVAIRLVLVRLAERMMVAAVAMGHPEISVAAMVVAVVGAGLAPTVMVEMAVCQEAEEAGPGGLVAAVMVLKAR